MQFQRLYIDSRDRVSGTPEDFEYQLATNIVVHEESIATLDTVLIPNSWYTVTKDVNDRIYVTESNFSNLVFRIATIAPGYYDVNSLATAIAAALTQGSIVISPYTCTYNDRLGRYEVSNVWTGNSEGIYITTQQSLLNGVADPTSWGVSRDDLRGAFRQIGMVSGGTVSGGRAGPDEPFGTTPLVFNDVPNLQNHTQVFIKGNLGIPGLSQGPRGAQDILRRCVITAPQLALNFDAAATHYDNIRIAPGTISTLRFTLQGFDGKTMDLQGQDWSFSIVIYPQD